MTLFLGKEFAYWTKLESLMAKFRLTEKDFDKIEGALSAIRNQSIEERVEVIEKRLGI